jgi:hypothetical protein
VLLKQIAPNDLSAVSTSILGPQYTPWVRPTWEVPDPLGANWRTERVGNLIVPPTYKTNTNGIAELPEGVFILVQLYYYL